MNIPINAAVDCTDSPGGQSVCVIINPASQQVTHVVVAEQQFPYLERLVPLALIGAGTSHQIYLRCTQEQLALLRPFVEIKYPVADTPYFSDSVDPYRQWPYPATKPLPVPLESEWLPPAAVTIHRGTPVKATDGRAGQVTGFLVEPQKGRITHLVLQEGWLWHKKYVIIPAGQLDRLAADRVYLKLDKQRLHQLPAVPAL